jgi:hypothetical protein
VLTPFLANTLDLFVVYEVTNTPMDQVLACRHGFLKKQGKPKCPIFQTGTSDFGKFQSSPAVEIGPTST